MEKNLYKKLEREARAGGGVFRPFARALALGGGAYDEVVDAVRR
jgi:hypothetical protein